MSDTHPMMALPTHDERAEQYFIKDLKGLLWSMVPAQKAIVDDLATRLAKTPGGASLDEVRDAVLEQGVCRDWIRYRRASQEMMWNAVTDSVDRQIDVLTAAGRIEQPVGSLELDPELPTPDYIAGMDVHQMPGGYMRDRSDDDIRQGAVMDRGGAIFLLGRNGGAMNDGRGHALVSHVFDRAPDIAPQRTLELGCGVGSSAVAVASYFPEAENWGIDIGASLLRYAHARAERIGVPMHFAQRNAEATRFPDNHFDLVYSCVVLHETSEAAVAAILKESLRILKPGGLMVHLEVPSRYDENSAWDQLQGEFENRYNNEPFWEGANTLDYSALVQETGFKDVMVGYQATKRPIVRGNQGFSLTSSGTFACWFVVSGVK
ncbi:MAG: class I SAM-dependent methyltransferase [Caulobacteraceae bacterium]